MKRIWIAAALALGMMVLCFFLLDHTKDITADLNSRLDRLSAVEEDDPSGDEQTRELCRVWEKYEKKLSLHIRHSELEEVTRAFTQIESCWRMGEYELFIMACDEARAAVDHLWEEARPTIKNIV